MLIKSNNPVPTSKKSSSFRDQNFLSLVILGLILAIYLTIYWRCHEDINRVFVLGIIYACFFFKFYQKQNEISFSSSFWSRLTGLLLIFIPLVRSRFLLIVEEGYDFRNLSLVFCLISIIGYIILIAGFRGLKKFPQELIFLGVASLFILLIKKLLAIILTVQSENNFISVISAKFATFFLWYLGFNPTNQGAIIHVNGLMGRQAR